MVQINTIGDWASVFSIIGVIMALLMAGYSIYKSSSDKYARKDIVKKDFELINKRLDDHEDMNKVEFGYLKEYLEEVRATMDNMNDKIDAILNRVR